MCTAAATLEAAFACGFDITYNHVNTVLAARPTRLQDTSSASHLNPRLPVRLAKPDETRLLHIQPLLRAHHNASRSEDAQFSY
jgi:hypothetical protein